MSFAGVVTVALVGVGAFFVLVAAFGLVRLRDVLMRMHASSKASTLGAICTLAAVAVRFGDGAVTATVRPARRASRSAASLRASARTRVTGR